MSTFGLLLGALGEHENPPSFIREMTDVGPVRVVRLQGPVGKEIGEQFTQVQDSAASEDPPPFQRSLLIDFAAVTNCDFATVAFLVKLLRNRQASGARVGIINAPPELLAEIRIAKIDSMLLVFESEAEAMAVLGDETRSGDSEPAAKPEDA